MTDEDLARAYRDRNLLAVAFCEAAWRLGYPAGWHRPTDSDDVVDDDEREEWIVVWAELPQGHVSWHVKVDGHVPHELPLREATGQYDGYERAEKNARLLAWASSYPGQIG